MFNYLKSSGNFEKIMFRFDSKRLFVMLGKLYLNFKSVLQLKKK